MLKYYPLKQLLPCCTKLPFTASQYFGKPKKKRMCLHKCLYAIILENLFINVHVNYTHVFKIEATP